jgi:hypothetical protein
MEGICTGGGEWQGALGLGELVQCGWMRGCWKRVGCEGWKIVRRGW